MENHLRMSGQVGNQPKRGAFSVQVVNSIPVESAVSLSTAQVAGQLGLEILDVLRLIARGELRANIVADRWHVDTEDLKSCMKVAKRWRVPTDLLETDYGTERKVRDRLLAACQKAVSDQYVLGEAHRLARPGMPIESVGVVNLQFNSPPAGFVQSLEDNSKAREMAITIRGESDESPVALSFAFAKSRLFNQVTRGFAQDIPLSKDRIGHLYSGPEMYRSVINAAVERVGNELIVVRETRLLEHKRQTVQVGSDLQVTVSRLPITVVYSLPVATLSLPLARIAQQIF
jgi:hypothetical protein